MKKWILVLLGGTLFSPLFAQTKKGQKVEAPAKETVKAEWLNGLSFRSVGPAVTSGRIIDLAVNPHKKHEYYVAVASGGVWKTINGGTTYEPVFDKEGSYSIGCITMDPQNPNLLWVGTGENNNQRSVAYGDGLYKSEDGGKSWKKMGLEKSEHIGMIAVNPTNSNEVYVAAYGPVWSSGGDRGIYKTTDGGTTWKRVLHVSEHTGFNEVHMDPRNPNTLYATAHQRQRKVFTYIGGGPESAIYKSTDGGATWQKIMSGLPSGDVGRIGMDISPVNPDILFAIVEGKSGGVYKSSDRGASWEKQGGYTTSGNYYQEIICDPKNADKLYSMDVFVMTSTDAGKTWKRYGEKHKHVDNHAIWIDPANTNHSLVGCDGGLYETWDNAANWHFKENLPVTQFYKVATDNASPFYNIYGGTQDNFSLGGPSRTNSANGIANSDWFVTNGGDGFESQVDQTNPNIIYAQSQYGGLVRFDKKSGENLFIQNVEEAGQPAFRWNWDAPLVISRHQNKRIYHAAQFLFKSNDQGGTWQTISPDLSRGLDRNKMPIMDRIWSADAIAKNGSTDIYGQVSALSESPLDENVLIAGTDDGLIHITDNGGKTWLKVDKIAGIPELCYVHTVWASQHNKKVFYAAFNNHRMGDFKPYLVKTTDGGQTWTSLNANLPERGSTYCIAEDHVNPDLLFAGTEFGLFVTVDGGASWTQMKSGLPTVAIRDIDIQRRENDLVLASFGYGFYVLDDYSPLRELSKGVMDKSAFIAPVKDALMFMENSPLGMRGKGFLGESHFATPNPTVGAVFTYFVNDMPKTTKQRRQEREKELIKKNEAVPYPSIDSLRAEDNEVEPYFILTIADEQGQVVRKLKAPVGKGLNRLTWDYRYAPFTPVSFDVFDPVESPFGSPDQGYRALPGNYTVSLGSVVGAQYSLLAGPQAFKATTLNNTSLPATDMAALKAFNQKVAALQRTISGTDAYRQEMANRLKFVKEALMLTNNAGTSLIADAAAITHKMTAIQTAMNGDATISRREMETLPGINGLIGNIAGALWSTSAAPTQTMEKSYALAVQKFTTSYQDIKKLDQELKALESTLEKAGAPFTPGRLPEWNGR